MYVFSRIDSILDFDSADSCGISKYAASALNVLLKDIKNEGSMSSFRQSPMTNSSFDVCRRQRVPVHSCIRLPTAISVLLVALIFTPLAECYGTYSSYSSCTSYCSESNSYVQGFHCTSLNPYCCGDENTRYCCNNQSLNIGDKYPSVCYSCFSSPCGFMSDWSAILLSVAVVLSLTFFIGCFCHCLSSMFGIKPCRNFCRTRTSPEVTTASAGDAAATRSSDGDDATGTRTGRRRGARRGRRHRQVEATDVPSVPTDFNPDHPFAFRPPDYDQLSMTINIDPPKYEDGEVSGGPVINNAFTNDEVDSSRDGTVEPPPSPDFDVGVDGRRTGDGFVVVNVNAFTETNTAEVESPPPYDDAVMTSSA